MGIYSRVIDAIGARLAYHSGTGRILDGYVIHSAPLQQVDGIADFPYVMILVPSINEPYKPKNVDSDMDVSILVTTKRALGIANHLQAVEKVLDALEISHDGANYVDGNLAHTIAKPFDARVTNAAIDISLTANITLACKPKPANRGARRT